MGLLVVLGIVGTALLLLLRRVVRSFPRLRTAAVSTALVALTALGVSWPLLHQIYEARFALIRSEPAIDWETTITHYDATYQVSAAGRLVAAEALTVDMPAGRHGIFRFFPAADPTDPHARLIPTVTEITMDDRPVPVDLSWHDDRTVFVAQIGDPDTTVAPGAHTYTIRYVIDGVLVKPPAAAGSFASRAGANPAPPSASFYYNVVGFWAMKAETARVVIELPGPAGLVQCAADAAGVRPCRVTGAGTDRVTVTATDLPAQNPVTVRVDLPVELPARATLPWPVQFDKMLGRSAPTAGLVALLSALAGLLGYGWARRSREPSPGHPVMYAPPDGLGPVQTVYIGNETVGPHGLAATLLYLAERNLVRLAGGGSKNWTITGTGTPEQWSAVDPVTRQVGEALGVVEPGEVFRASASKTAGEKLSAATSGLASGCSAWSRGQGLMVTAGWERLGRAAVVIAALGAFAGFCGLFTSTMWGLPFAVFVVAGAGLLSTGVGTRRTPSGRQLWARAAGFERLLSTPSSEDRFDFSARKHLFTAYIPYAVAFGVADRWAAKYRAVTGQEPPVPGWYPAPSSGAAKLYSAGGFTSFNSALAASISAYQAAQSSSSGSGGSSFSSGGGSWGGGGGGGGGTW